MGIHLTLLPLKEKTDLKECKGHVVLCRERIEFNQDYRIFGQLKDFSKYREDDPEIPERPSIIPEPIPQNIWVKIWDDEGIKRVRDDYWGDGLTYVYAEALKHIEVAGDSSAKNKAIKAFLNALPSDTPIILFWC